LCISFVLPLTCLHSISCFGGIWVRRIWAIHMLLSLHQIHRFEFSSEIHGSESLWTYYSWVLGALDNFVVFMVPWWRFLGASN
jgi:hypothetical protein